MLRPDGHLLFDPAAPKESHHLFLPPIWVLSNSDIVELFRRAKPLKSFRFEGPGTKLIRG